MVCSCPLVPLFWALRLGVTLTPSQCRGGVVLSPPIWRPIFVVSLQVLLVACFFFRDLTAVCDETFKGLEFAAPTFANSVGSQFAFFGCSLHKNHKVARGEFPSIRWTCLAQGFPMFSVIFTLGVCTIYWDHKISLFTLFLFGDTKLFFCSWNPIFAPSFLPFWHRWWYRDIPKWFAGVTASVPHSWLSNSELWLMKSLADQIPFWLVKFQLVPSKVPFFGIFG